jgi:hypothetical protein
MTDRMLVECLRVLQGQYGICRARWTDPVAEAYSRALEDLEDEAGRVACLRCCEHGQVPHTSDVRSMAIRLQREMAPKPVNTAPVERCTSMERAMRLFALGYRDGCRQAGRETTPAEERSMRARIERGAAHDAGLVKLSAVAVVVGAAFGDGEEDPFA